MTNTVPDAGKGGRNMKLIALMFLLTFILGAGAGIYSYSAFGPDFEADVADAKNEEDGATPLEKQSLEIGRITMTLQDGLGGKPRHLLINPIVVIEADEEEAESEKDPAAALKPVLRDSFVEYLSQLTVRDVSGSAGMSLVRKELARRASAHLENKTVTGVLFQDFVIQ